MTTDSARPLAAEALGTGLLVAAVVGSGIMAASLSADGGVALLGNTIPTGAILVVLITILGPVSGAHLNPAVTLVFALRREVAVPLAAGYVLAQLIGAILGAFLAHAMFDLPLLQIGTISRQRDRPVAGRGHRNIRSDRHHPGWPTPPAGRGRLAGRPLHHGCILVHRLDELRQPGRRHRARLFGHLRRHPASGCPGFRAGGNCRWDGRAGADGLAAHDRPRTGPPVGQFWAEAVREKLNSA